MEIDKNDRLLIDGELVTVIAASQERTGFNCVIKSPTRGLAEAFVLFADIPACKVPSSDGSGDSGRAITGVWAQWMRWAIPRIRSAVLATRPLRPYAHQDDAVFSVMLPQPRLRLLLADEPGTGPTAIRPALRAPKLLPNQVTAHLPTSIATDLRSRTEAWRRSRRAELSRTSSRRCSTSSIRKWWRHTVARPTTDPHGRSRSRGEG